MSVEGKISDYIEKRLDKKSVIYALIYNCIGIPVTKERLAIDTMKFVNEEEEARAILKSIIYRLSYLIGDLDYSLTLFAKAINLCVDKKGEENFINTFLKSADI